MSLIAYLVRHAEPEKGTGIRYDVPPGPPLSARGREEAQKAAAFLADKGIKRLFCSPLVRARDTAGIIGHILRLQPIPDDRLAEHRSDETFEAVIARVQAFWEMHAVESDGPLALVTHGSPIRALLTLLGNGRLDWSRYQFPDNNIVPMAGIWRVECGAGEWKLELVFAPSEG